MPVQLAGVINVTPDSFSDGGRFLRTEDAVAEGLRMVEAGAQWLDVGGESTRPGALPVPEAMERERVLPVIEKLAVLVSGRARIAIDTYKAGTAEAALRAGASIVNDVSGGRMDPAIYTVARDHAAGIVLGHLRESPATMMTKTVFNDVLAEVGFELAVCIEKARQAGCGEIWADPGIGFGKGLEDNLTLLAKLPELRAIVGVPLMVGVSRKRFIGELTGRAVGDRLFGTAGAVAAAVFGGAEILRVHDVAEMRDVVLVAETIARKVSREGKGIKMPPTHE
jgi:dihydropteroate synthase